MPHLTESVPKQTFRVNDSVSYVIIAIWGKHMNALAVQHQLVHTIFFMSTIALLPQFLECSLFHHVQCLCHLSAA
jgi:hypothetical protein